MSFVDPGCLSVKLNCLANIFRDSSVISGVSLEFAIEKIAVIVSVKLNLNGFYRYEPINFIPSSNAIWSSK